MAQQTPRRQYDKQFKIYYCGALGRGLGVRVRDVLEGAAGGEWEHCAGGRCAAGGD